MSEKPLQFESAEKQFEMDVYEVRAIECLHDPVTALHKLRDNVVSAHGELTTVALIAADVLAEVRDYARNEDVESSHPELQRFIEANDETHKSNAAFVSLLHEAGFSRAEMITWANTEVDTSSPEERLAERGSLALVNELYGTNE